MNLRLIILLCCFSIVGYGNNDLPIYNCPTCPPEIDWGDWSEKIFNAPDFFSQKSSVLQLGIGFLSNVNLSDVAQQQDQLDTKLMIPSISLTYERNVWKNFGVGLTIAHQVWKVPVFGYQYRYYSGSLRTTYHLGILEKLDPYMGLTLGYRYMSLTNKSQNVHQSHVQASWVLGARYYFSNRFGGFLEFGDDALTWGKLGISYYLR